MRAGREVVQGIDGVKWSNARSFELKDGERGGGLFFLSLYSTYMEAYVPHVQFE